MNHTDVLREIKNKQIRSVYLLYGEETYFTRQLEKAIIDAVLTPEECDMNLVVFNQDPPFQELVTLIETIPFLGGRNVIVIRGTSLFKARRGSNDENQPTSGSNDEQLIRLLSNMPDYSHLVMSTTDKVDKRRKLFKTVEAYGIAAEMAPLKLGDIRGWLNTKLVSLNKNMAQDAIEHLLGAIALMPQISLSFLDNEIEKLALYSGNRNITLEDTEQVLASIPEVSVFVLIDALSQKQKAKALELLNQQLAAGDHPLRILALLVRQIRMLWQAKELAAQGINARTLAASIGVPPFVGEKVLRQSRNFSHKTLKEALLALAAADYELKAGKSDNIALERIIIELCQ